MQGKNVMIKLWLCGMALPLLLGIAPALAQKTLVGVTDIEIKVGQSASPVERPAPVAIIPPLSPTTSR
jgi:hypothetical protein